MIMKYRYDHEVAIARQATKPMIKSYLCFIASDIEMRADSRAAHDAPPLQQAIRCAGRASHFKEVKARLLSPRFAN